MAKYVFGIDLGTTYSCISYVDETGRAVVVKNMEGDNTTPSVVNFANENQVIVGQVALENAIIDPDNTVSLVKTLIGKSDFVINYNGEDKSPEEISAYILKKITNDAASLLDTKVEDVVITCPAYFGTAERTATKNACKIAGLNVIDIINEPTAAALYYGCIKDVDDKTVLVYDLGGGTFDVTIMSISSEKIEVICSEGNAQLGGKDWDEAVMRYVADEFCGQTEFEGEFDEYTRQELRLKVERAKKQLSSREEVPIALSVEGKRAEITLTRERFDEITTVYLAETLEKTDSAIAIAKEKGVKIDEILLVGGSTRMPQISKALVEKYGIWPKVLEPDEAVAKGAAMHALNVYDSKVNANKNENDVENDSKQEEAQEEQPKVELAKNTKEVIVATNKSFAIHVFVNNQHKCHNMIIKNQPMSDGAISVSKIFGTHKANQKNAEIIVYENDIMEEMFDECTDFILGTVVLDLPPNLPEHSPLEVTLTLNTEGILEVTAVEKTTNTKVSAVMKAKGIMPVEKVEEITKKAENVEVK